MLPLGDHVFDKLRQMRSNTEPFGGANERGLKNFREYTDRVDQEMCQKSHDPMREVARLNSIDHQIQPNRARMLMQRHDMRPNR